MVNRDALAAALAEYELRFGEPLGHPPFSLGHVHIELEDFVAIALEAVREGVPVVWEDRYPPLPPDAVS